MNETSLDEGVELPDENALPTAKAKKHGSKRLYARRGFPFRFALNSSEDSEFTIVSSRSPSRGSMRTIGI